MTLHKQSVKKKDPSFVGQHWSLTFHYHVYMMKTMVNTTLKKGKVGFIGKFYTYTKYCLKQISGFFVAGINVF